MKNHKEHGGSGSSRIADARFASFETDPRFRLPSKKQTKTTIDKRFSHMLKDADFTATSQVDRYGRKIKSDSKKKALQSLYREEEEADEDEDEQEGLEQPAEDEAGIDDDDLVQRQLRAADKKHDPARGGGFSSSESDSDSDESEDDEDGDGRDGEVELESEGELQRLQDDQLDVETGEVTNRLAVVNLDWDHIRSPDLMALFSSFIPSDSGRIKSVSIYPSEFGKVRMQREELDGPPKELFKRPARESDDELDEGSDESESDDEEIKKQLIEEGNDQDFDGDALRSYQLDRLRYYYAVVVCSSPTTAQAIYEATDGTEYQSSSNFLDLRFVPDDVTFDDEPRDECDRVPDAYKPIEFVTNALQSSKVKLTWDMHPEEASRKESIKRAFGGSRSEIQENDLRAYLASDSESEDDVEGDVTQDDHGVEKMSKKELARKKMREALGLANESKAKGSKVAAAAGGMQITFAPALTESKPKNADKEETTIEKYMRKERERKEMKRQKARAKRDGLDSDAEQPEALQQGEGGAEEDLGFDDPFFTTDEPAPVSKASVRKEDRRKKREAREAAEADSLAQKAQLSRVMAEDVDDSRAAHLDHFDMNEILRAEKQKQKRGKSKKKAKVEESARGGLQQDFAMDVGDERFQAVFENHEFAIDPSNPKFKASEGMKQLLEEGRKKRRGGGVEDERRHKKSKKERR